MKAYNVDVYQFDGRVGRLQPAAEARLRVAYADYVKRTS
jgi:hypothetical protein